MRMLGYLIFTTFLAGFFSCSALKSTKSTTKLEPGVEINEADEELADSTEYELIIFDPGFESWFQKHRKQPWYHTKESLENKNWLYSIAWNQKVMDGNYQMTYPGNPFEQEIDYRKNIDYGMDLNYRLYYYFKYVEDTWGKFM